MSIVNIEIPVGPSGLALVSCVKSLEGKLTLLPGQLLDATEHYQEIVHAWIDAHNEKIDSR